MDRLSGLPNEVLAELKEKTRELRKSLMATVVLVDASVAARNEWVSVITDYVGPQLNHISGKFLDHQVRDADAPVPFTYRCERVFLASNGPRHVWTAVHTPEPYSLQAILQQDRDSQEG